MFEFGVSNPRFKHQILLEDGFRIIVNRRFFRTCALHTILQRKAASERRFCASRERCCWVLGSCPAPAPLLKQPAEAHRAVISASRYRYGCSLCRPGAAKPAAKPAAAANSAAMDSNRRAWSVFSWLSTAAATASACGAAEVVNVCRLVCPLRVNPAACLIPWLWLYCTVRS